jgi:hypothetical protein
MKTLAYIICALACLTMVPLAATSAKAQVSVGIGQDGPTVHIGPARDRVIDRDREHVRRDFRSNRDYCRDETVTFHHRDGSETVRTSRRCD